MLRDTSPFSSKPPSKEQNSGLSNRLHDIREIGRGEEDEESPRCLKNISELIVSFLGVFVKHESHPREEHSV